VHPVIAAAAQELLNKSENERSGVLSTAMSFLGLYRDPVVAKVTGASDWRIADLMASPAPVSLYLVVPPGDISRTKPLIRLILNQIGRRLTEELNPSGQKQRLLLMLDEFPALGRLDFFESALAFMAGYGIKSFLIAQSLNQIDKAYGTNNAILDNCHVRVSFGTNDEHTAERISDALGTATEMKNYAGHRLSPWLGHLMVSRTETPRQLLTVGEIMQLPKHEEIVMVSSVPPIRATKARYFEDARLARRIIDPPVSVPLEPKQRPKDDWSESPPIPAVLLPAAALKANEAGKDASGTANTASTSDPANAGLRREPGLPEHVDIAPEPERKRNEFEFDDAEDEAPRNRRTADRIMERNARTASLDPADGIDL
jgi:type IV secretion system protein VirD4